MPKGPPRFSVMADRHILLASIVANLLSLALPLMMLQVYDRVIPSKSFETLTALALGLIVAVCCELLIRGARTRLMAIAGDKYERRLHGSIFERLLKLDLATIEREPPGVHMDRIQSVDKVRAFRTGDAAMAILDLPFSLIYLIVVALVSPVLALVILCLLICSIIVTRSLHGAYIQLNEKRNEIDRRRYSFLIETLRGIESVKSHGIEAFMERRYERLVGSSAESGATVAGRSNFTQAITGSIGQLTPVIIAAAGAVLVVQHALTIGALATAILLASRIVQPVLKYESLKAGDEDIQRAERELNGFLAHPLPSIHHHPISRIETLEFENVTYTPEGHSAPLFQNLNLKINAGEMIAIQGANGSGKSSLLWLAMGYLPVEQGRVLVNHHEIDRLDHRLLRQRIAYMPQHPRMLEGTVLENMTRFQPELYLDDALEVTCALGLDEYFARHQQGLTVKVGHGLHAGLPTSVADRVPLVGSLVGNPELILFDEANSTLDSDGDAKLRAYIASLKAKRTIILNSQRPSYVNLADRVYEIAQGQLHEIKPASTIPAAAAGGVA